MDRTEATGRAICFPGWTGAFLHLHSDPTTPYLLAPDPERMGEKAKPSARRNTGGFAVWINAKSKVKAKQAI